MFKKFLECLLCVVTALVVGWLLLSMVVSNYCLIDNCYGDALELAMIMTNAATYIVAIIAIIYVNYKALH